MGCFGVGRFEDLVFGEYELDRGAVEYVLCCDVLC